MKRQCKNKKKTIHNRVCEICHRSFTTAKKITRRCPECQKRISRAQSYLAKRGIKTRGMSPLEVLAIEKEMRGDTRRPCAWCGKETRNRVLCDECTKLGKIARKWCVDHGIAAYTFAQALFKYTKEGGKIEDLKKYKPIGKKPKREGHNGRYCTKCGKPLRNNWFICKKCLERMPERVDGNWVYD